MARTRLANQVPSLKNWGGVRSVQRRLERSQTIIENREAVAYSLLCMANTKITDILTWDEEGNVKVKAASAIPDHALQAIKNIKVTKGKDGASTLEVELYDKVGVLRLLAKASGLLDNPDDGSEKPSVIGINVQAPEMKTRKKSVMPDSFDGWLQRRQDARTWTEDELAVARLVWREAWRVAHRELDDLRARIRILEQGNRT